MKTFYKLLNFNAIFLSIGTVLTIVHSFVSNTITGVSKVYPTLKDIKDNQKRFFTCFFISILLSANAFSLPVTVNGSVSLDYADLTSAFNAINTGTHGSGNITVLINETHSLLSSAILNGGVFASCLIKPAAEVTVSGSVIYDGADNVTFDGRVGSENNIKLILTGSIIMKNGASDNVVKFVEFHGSISIAQSIPGSGGNNNITVEDCIVNIAITSQGTPGASGYANKGIKLLRNTVSWYVKISNETKDVEIRNNSISLYNYGIWNPETGITLNSVGIINVTGNKGSSMKLYPKDLTSPGSSNTEININNNVFSQYYNLSCNLFHCDFFAEVFVFSTEFISNITANICYNTMTLNGIATSLPWWDSFYAVNCLITATTGNIIFKNNIVEGHLNEDKIGHSPTGSYIFVSGATIDADYNSYNYAKWNSWWKVDKNDYRKSELNSGITDDIYEYRLSAFPNEQHSIFKDLNFVDVTTGNLHLTGSSIGDEDLVGIPIPGITNDIDGDFRDEFYPYRGADEANITLPVELSSFTSSVSNSDVQLNWTTATETNNSGFEIERSDVIEQSSDNWKKIGFVNGNGNTPANSSYQFTNRGLSQGKYNYRLKQIDFNGNFNYHNLSDEVIVGSPDKFSLSQNYPNPFNPSTKINYDLPFDANVSLKVFDMRGREVASLVNEFKTAGYYVADFNASNLSTGVYMYRISADANGQSFTSEKRMVLVK